MLSIPPAEACTIKRAAQLPITLWQDKLYIPVSIDGAPTMMFIDTGAATTAISQNFAAAQSLPRDFDHTTDAFGVGGVESHLYIVHTRTLSLGGITLRDTAAPVAEFAGRLADGAPVGGLIGADVLARFDVEIDIPHRLLALWQVDGCTEVTPDWGAASNAVAMTVQDSRHASVPVKIDGVTVELLLDTGSPGLVLSTRAAARAGAAPELLEEGRPLHGSGVNDRAFSAWLHIFARLDVAGQVFGDVRAVVVNNGRLQTGDGLLGVAFMKRGRVWLSYATGRFFFER